MAHSFNKSTAHFNIVFAKSMDYVESMVYRNFTFLQFHYAFEGYIVQCWRVPQRFFYSPSRGRTACKMIEKKTLISIFFAENEL